MVRRFEHGELSTTKTSSGTYDGVRWHVYGNESEFVPGETYAVPRIAELGKQGWELIAAPTVQESEDEDEGFTQQTTYYFKRRLA